MSLAEYFWRCIDASIDGALENGDLLSRVVDTYGADGGGIGKGEIVRRLAETAVVYHCWMVANGGYDPVHGPPEMSVAPSDRCIAAWLRRTSPCVPHWCLVSSLITLCLLFF